jgi:flagellar protein FlgJ
LKTSGINGYGSDIIKDTYKKIQQDSAAEFEDLLNKARAEKDKQRLKEACREMEAVFINTVLQRMRATIVRDGLIKESLGEEIFTAMLDEELARKISMGEGTGIADLLYRQLSQNIEK